MKVLFVYSNVTCACTRKYTFELENEIKKYVESNILYYKNLTDNIIKRYDIVIFQRVGTQDIITKEDYENIFNIISKNRDNTKFVYLIDDLILESQNCLPIKFIRTCDAVLCTSNTLARYIKNYNDKVYTFHTFIEASLWDKVEFNKYDNFTMVWASTGGLGSNIIREIIDNIEIKYKLIAIGGGAIEFKGVKNIDVYPILPEKEMIGLVKGAQLLLNPLTLNDRNIKSLKPRCYAPLDDFLNSKTEIKYAIAGITKTCLLTSPIERCREAIDNGVNGFLIDDNPKEWINRILYLYNNQDKICEIAQNSYNDVIKNYDVSNGALEVFNILKQIK